ncbi:hypothetical protein MRX96_049866 [Rhipicephalus microplus]
MSSASSPHLGAFTFKNGRIIVMEDTQPTPVDAHAASDIQRRMLQVLQPRQDVTALHQSAPTSWPQVIVLSKTYADGWADGRTQQEADQPLLIAFPVASGQLTKSPPVRARGPDCDE